MVEVCKKRKVLRVKRCKRRGQWGSGGTNQELGEMRFKTMHDDRVRQCNCKHRDNMRKRRSHT